MLKCVFIQQNFCRNFNGINSSVKINTRRDYALREVTDNRSRMNTGDMPYAELPNEFSGNLPRAKCRAVACRLPTKLNLRC